MKKDKNSGKENTDSEKKPGKRMRFLTAVLLLAILCTLGSGAYWYYDTFIAEPGFVSGSPITTGIEAIDKVLSGGEKAILANEVKEQEEKEAEIDALGLYAPMGEPDPDIVVSSDSSAKEALVALQSEINFSNADSAFALESSYVSGEETVYTFQQYYDRIRVYGHQLRMVVSAKGNVTYLHGNCTEIPNEFDTSTKYSRDDAKNAIAKYMKTTISSTKTNTRLILSMPSFTIPMIICQQSGICLMLEPVK